MSILNLINKSSLKDFLLLWFGQSLSKLGSFITSFALIIWVYKTENTVMSTALLSVFSYLPYALISFLAGSIIDRFHKKKILLFCDFVAVLCTLSAFILLLTGHLEVWHLYLINFISGLMNAVQDPASKVVCTLIVPRKYYTKTNGVLSLSDSIIMMLNPIIATFILSIFGINMVFIIDLITFVIAVVILIFFINIPHSHDNNKSTANLNVIEETIEGFKYLKSNKGFLYMIIYNAGINLIAYMIYLNILPIMILARTSGNEQILGIVMSFGGIGAIVGGLIVTILKPPQNLVKMTFVICAFVFLVSDTMIAVSNNVILWSAATFIGNFCIPFFNAYQNTAMQMKIPVTIQGRIFSIQGSLQRITIPIGYFLGGYLADSVFEPLMKNSETAQSLFGGIVGTGHGSGMAIMFIYSAILGGLISIFACRNKYIKEI